jgi:hypothetical protein
MSAYQCHWEGIFRIAEAKLVVAQQRACTECDESAEAGPMVASGALVTELESPRPIPHRR